MVTSSTLLPSVKLFSVHIMSVIKVYWIILFLGNIVVSVEIALCGSEDQKQKYLPSLAQFKTVACWVRFPSSPFHFFGCLLEGLRIIL